MNYRIKENGEAAVIAFEGDLDVHTGRKVREVLVQLATHVRELVIDLSGVAAADTVLAANLAEAAHLARSREASIVLRGVAPAIQKILDLTRLTQIFGIETRTPDVLHNAVAG